VSRIAERMGYERRSVWSFARPGAPSYTSITRRRFVGMGAGASSVTGEDFFVNHFGVTAYVEAVEAGRLPVARWFHLGRWAGGVYDAFWQAYAGGIDAHQLGADHGRFVGGAARTVLEPLRWAGLVTDDGPTLGLTPRGLDVYHDLERAVTYQLIEPLWGEMLREHMGEGTDVTPDIGGGGAFWATPERARHGRVWGTSRRVLERPVSRLFPAPVSV
jgi:oxygen-independent coproporphyrinogen-3 oxidase